MAGGKYCIVPRLFWEIFSMRSTTSLRSPAWSGACACVLTSVALTSCMEISVTSTSGSSSCIVNNKKLFFTTLTNNSALLQIDMIKTSQKEIYSRRVASHSNRSTMFSSTFYAISKNLEKCDSRFFIVVSLLKKRKKTTLPVGRYLSFYPRRIHWDQGHPI